MKINKKYFIKIIICAFVGLCSNAYAASKIISDVNIGLFFSSLSQRRGVIFYRDFQIDPVITFNIINEDWKFDGDSIAYKKCLQNNNICYRGRVQNLPAQPIFPNKKSIFYRKDSTEFSSRIEYTLLSNNGSYMGELSLELDKDLYTHHGEYVEFGTKLKLFSYKYLEPNLLGTIGYGSSENNIYYYGKTANQAAFNNISLGLVVLVPKIEDRFYPVMKIIYFNVLQDNNKNAEYAINNNHGWVFSIVGTYPIFD
jgi:hypothetical protein